MPIAINGSGTITGLSVGGLPDGTVDADTLASGATSDNTPAFVAYKTAEQDTTQNTDTLLEMSTEGLDTDSAYDTSTSKFTVPSGKGGYYLIGVTLTINEGSAHYYKVIMYKNGSGGFFQNGYTTDTSNTVGKFTTQWAVSLAAGDYIQLYGWCNGGSANERRIYKDNQYGTTCWSAIRIAGQ